MTIDTVSDSRPELAIFDQVNQQAVELRELTDSGLLAEVHLADLDARIAREKYDDLLRKIEGVREKNGPNAAAQLLTQELAAAQAVNLAQLRLVTAQGEQRRHREWNEQEAAQREALGRAQRLEELRRAAWQQFQTDMGRTIDGSPLADRSAFDAHWAGFLADLAIGRVTLPES